MLIKFKQLNLGSGQLKNLIFRSKVGIILNLIKITLFSNEEPDLNIKLLYIYGYRSNDCRNNLRYLENKEIAYHCANVCVILNC